jgi:hypothetical protein
MCQAQESVFDLQKSPSRGSASMVAKRKKEKEKEIKEEKKGRRKEKVLMDLATVKLPR